MKTKTPKTKKKPVKTPQPPPGCEIVGKDDPRLDCLPARVKSYFPASKEWLDMEFEPGDKVPDNIRHGYLYALPIATPAQPTMIRLRPPSHKETMSDTPKTDAAFDAYCRGAAGLIDIRGTMEGMERENAAQKDALTKASASLSDFLLGFHADGLPLEAVRGLSELLKEIQPLIKP